MATFVMTLTRENQPSGWFEFDFDQHQAGQSYPWEYQGYNRMIASSKEDAIIEYENAQEAFWEE